MATITKYICDACGAENDSNEQMWCLAISIENHQNPRRFGGVPDKNLRAMWCRACVERSGLLPQSIETKGEEIQPATLEDMIRAIAREEVAALTGAA